MAGRAVGEQHELVAAFRQRDEQRQQDRADEQPVADLHVDRDGAGHRAQHEPDGDRQHVDDDDVLERAGVEREQRQIRRGDDEEAGAERERACQRHHAQHDRGRQRRRHRQRARRNRTPRLVRMLAIAVAIGDVVDQVHDA